MEKVVYEFDDEKLTRVISSAVFQAMERFSEKKAPVSFRPHNPKPTYFEYIKKVQKSDIPPTPERNQSII